MDFRDHVLRTFEREFDEFRRYWVWILILSVVLFGFFVITIQIAFTFYLSWLAVAVWAILGFINIGIACVIFENLFWPWYLENVDTQDPRGLPEEYRGDIVGQHPESQDLCPICNGTDEDCIVRPVTPKLMTSKMTPRPPPDERLLLETPVFHSRSNTVTPHATPSKPPTLADETHRVKFKEQTVRSVSCTLSFKAETQSLQEEKLLRVLASPIKASPKTSRRSRDNSKSRDSRGRKSREASKGKDRKSISRSRADSKSQSRDTSKSRSRDRSKSRSRDRSKSHSRDHSKERVEKRSKRSSTALSYRSSIYGSFRNKEEPYIHTDAPIELSFDERKTKKPLNPRQRKERSRQRRRRRRTLDF